MIKLVAFVGMVAIAALSLAEDLDAQLRRILDDPKPQGSDIKMAKDLLHRGASFKCTSPRGITVLMFAAAWGDVPFVRAAIKAGVDVNARSTDNGWTALMRADVPKSRILLDAGADPNAQDGVGRTPLMCAAMSKSRDKIELLLARGARPEIRNHKGYTAVVYAEGSPALQKFLRDRGAR